MEQDKGNKKKKDVQKYNLKDVDDIWGSLQDDEDLEGEEELFAGESLLYGDSSVDASTEAGQDLDNGDGQYEVQDLLYDDSSSDFVLEDSQAFDAGDEQTDTVDLTEEILAAETEEDEPVSEEPVSEEPAESAPIESEFKAIINFAAGLRMETSRARLFHPRENTIWMIDDETGDELSIPFNELTCIQLSGIPTGISVRQKESSRRETIETNDGKTHQVLVSPEQDLDRKSVV